MVGRVVVLGDFQQYLERWDENAGPVGILRLGWVIDQLTGVAWRSVPHKRHHLVTVIFQVNISLEYKDGSVRIAERSGFD